MEDMKIKYTVIKNEDIYQHLGEVNQKKLALILKTINNGRALKLKKPNNKYIVINTDEPYADEIVEILKKNNHWG
jgi:3'-phosphoadenosine 5'-phosphosulfate sulfotransferase